MERRKKVKNNLCLLEPIRSCSLMNMHLLLFLGSRQKGGSNKKHVSLKGKREGRRATVRQ